MLRTVKAVAKKLPFVSYSYRLIREAFSGPPKPPTMQDIFTNIVKNNEWKGVRSVSGGGSDLDQTERIAKELPALLNDLEISTMLDIPCGDFHWMKTVDLDGVKYVGADIVKDLIDQNQKYQTDKISFKCADVMFDKLPRVDLVFCRDCLVHLSFADTFRALKNICDSGSTYLLTTSFPERMENIDIVTGSWRPLNLEKEPFNFPAPLRSLVEGCTENDGIFNDKSLALWKIRELCKFLPE